MGKGKRYGLDDAAGVVWGSSAWQAVAGAWRDEGGPEAVAVVARAAGRVLVRVGRWLSRRPAAVPAAVTVAPAATPSAVVVAAAPTPLPVVAVAAEAPAPAKATPKRPRKPRSAVAAVLAERVAVGGSVYFRKGTRYVPCADPARWNPADGSLYTRHGTGRQTRYTEFVPARAR